MDFRTLKNDFKIRFNTDTEPDCVFAGYRLEILGDLLPVRSESISTQLSVGTGLVFAYSKVPGMIRIQNSDTNICLEYKIKQLEKYQEDNFEKDILLPISKLYTSSEHFGIDMLFKNNTECKLFNNYQGAVELALQKLSNKPQKGDLRFFFPSCKVLIIDVGNKKENLISLSKKVYKKTPGFPHINEQAPEKFNLSLSEENMYRFMLNEKIRIEKAKNEKKFDEIYKIISESGDELISFSSSYSFINMYKFIKKTEIAFAHRPCFENSMIFAIVANSDVDKFINTIQSEYEKKADKVPAFYICDTI